MHNGKIPAEAVKPTHACRMCGSRKEVYLNASATIGADGSSLVFKATAPTGFTPLETSYGRASWPMTVFFSSEVCARVRAWVCMRVRVSVRFDVRVPGRILPCVV